MNNMVLMAGGAVLSGLLAAWALNRSLQRLESGGETGGETGAERGHYPESDEINLENFPVPPHGRAAEIFHFAVLGASSLALSISPLGASPLGLLQGLLMLLVLYPLAVLDLYTLQVVSPLVVLGLVLRLGSLALWHRAGLPDALAGMLAGAGGLYMVGFAYETIRGRMGLGDGDAAVLGLIGSFTGWRFLPMTVLLATVLGLLFSVLLLRGKNMFSTPIPFVPFLCLGGLAAYLTSRLGLPWM